MPDIFYDCEEDNLAEIYGERIFDNSIVAGLAHSLLTKSKFARKPPREGIEQLLQEVEESFFETCDLDAKNYYEVMMSALKVILTYY